jgi:hypothetical protein
MKSRFLLTAAVAALASTSALAATPAAPAAAANPWSKVPAPPTACYQSQDQYLQQNSAALDVVNNEMSEVIARNDEIKEKFDHIQETDPMAMARAMQEAMMADPQNAQKYMQQAVQKGQDFQTEAPAALEREAQIEAEEKSVVKQYQAALATAYGPANARWTALKKKMGIPMDSPGPGEMGVPDWAWAEWGVILRERDQAYQATCATWFSPTGPLQAYLKRYKTFLVQERIPYEKKIIDEPRLEQYQMMGISTAGYRTTTDYDAVGDYLKMAFRIFAERNERPYCSSDGRCE